MLVFSALAPASSQPKGEHSTASSLSPAQGPCSEWCYDPSAWNMGSSWNSSSSWTKRCERPEGQCRGCPECSQRSSDRHEKGATCGPDLVGYVHINKAGGTSIVNALDECIGEGHLLGRGLHHFSAAEYVDKAERKGEPISLLFTVLRDPYARQVSLFYYSLEMCSQHGGHQCWDLPAKKDMPSAAEIMANESEISRVAEVPKCLSAPDGGSGVRHWPGASSGPDKPFCIDQALVPTFRTWLRELDRKYPVSSGDARFFTGTHGGSASQRVDASQVLLRSH